MDNKTKEALEEYAEGFDSADVIAEKYGIRIDDLYKAYAKSRASGGHSEDCQAGYAEGVEVGKTICESAAQNKTCISCGWIDEFDGCNMSIYHYDIPALIELSGCGKWEGKK